MFRTRLFSLLAALLCLWVPVMEASAAQVPCDSVYCFSAEDFGSPDLKGICITQLPDSHVGTVMLGTRVLRPGDILTAGQVSQMTFCPLLTEVDASAQVGYLPIYENTVETAAAMSIAVRGKEDKAPVAEDSASETYKNIPGSGKLKAHDPEGQNLTFTVTRQPRRGSVTIAEDGSFTYTPRKNKVGVDSFTFTATDPAGKVSREATVTVTILKPTNAPQYTDTAGRDCRFAAEWMKNTGIFEGEQLAGNPCFQPDRQVTRGEFLTMLVRALDIPAREDAALTGYTDEIPVWLQPYLAAAVRSGLTDGLPEQGVFGADVPITAEEASVLLRNALDLSAGEDAPVMAEDTSPEWARNALAAVSREGFCLSAGQVLTRADAAMAVYQAAKYQPESVFTE